MAGDSDLGTNAMGIDGTSKWESLDRKPSYTALSHIWGEEAPCALIWANSQLTGRTQVRQELESIVVDALDKYEKRNQVHMKCKIYERAIEVFDSLGPAKHDHDIAVERFENMEKKAWVQHFRASIDGRDNEDPLAAIGSTPPYEVDIERRGRYAGDDDSLPEMISSSPAENISGCLHEIRRTHIGETIENIPDHEVVASDSDRDNNVENLGDPCGGVDHASEVISWSQSDRPTRASSSYTKVSVLLLTWDDEDQGVQDEISKLETVFEKTFNFLVEDSAAWRIPSQTSTQELQKKVFEFLDLHRRQADLVVVYYNGHGKAHDPRHGRRTWPVSGLSGLEKIDIENRGENDHGHIGSWDSDPDIEKRGKHVFSSYRLGDPASEDAPLGARLDKWTRIKAYWTHLRTWVFPSTSRDKSPGWAQCYNISHPWRNTDKSPQRFSRIDRICLGLNQIVCPTLVWILLRSLHLEPPSLLDRKLQQLIPFASNAIVALEDYPRTALILVVHLLSLSVVAILKPAASINGRTNLYVCPCWILSLTCGLLSWSLIGGSLLEFCLLFVPFALSLGMTLGLLTDHLWQLR